MNAKWSLSPILLTVWLSRRMEAGCLLIKHRHIQEVVDVAKDCMIGYLKQNLATESRCDFFNLRNLYYFASPLYNNL